jgi:hypothetical protein
VSGPGIPVEFVLFALALPGAAVLLLTLGRQPN